MFKNTIRKEILKRVNAKIDHIEKEYEEKCDAIDSDARSAKLVAREAAIDTIIGKIM
jgi:hypothetical protein